MLLVAGCVASGVGDHDLAVGVALGVILVVDVLLGEAVGAGVNVSGVLRRDGDVGRNARQSA